MSGSEDLSRCVEDRAAAMSASAEQSQEHFPGGLLRPLHLHSIVFQRHKMTVACNPRIQSSKDPHLAVGRQNPLSNQVPRQARLSSSFSPYLQTAYSSAYLRPWW